MSPKGPGCESRQRVANCQRRECNIEGVTLLVLDERVCASSWMCSGKQVLKAADQDAEIDMAMWGDKEPNEK